MFQNNSVCLLALCFRKCNPILGSTQFLNNNLDLYLGLGMSKYSESSSAVERDMSIFFIGSVGTSKLHQ